MEPRPFTPPRFRRQLVAIYIHAVFPIHTIANVGRMYYDVFGEENVVKLTPLFYLTQGWQLIPLVFGLLTYQTLFLILAVIDYTQHGLAAAFWAYYLHKGDAPQRYWPNLYGVIFHMVSLVPLLIFFEQDISVAKEQTALHVAAVLFMIVSMFASQCFWIQSALLTPPDSGKFVRVPSLMERQRHGA